MVFRVPPCGSAARSAGDPDRIAGASFRARTNLRDALCHTQHLRTHVNSAISTFPSCARPCTVAVVGCDSAGPSTDSSEVEVGFATSSSASSTNAFGKAAADAPLVVSGSNDTLRIHDLRLIVDEVRLEGEADGAEFETEAPVFLDLPLNPTEIAPVAAGNIPPGLYSEFDFEVEDAELDDGDDDEGLQNLRDNIRAAGFENWPNEASMVVQGTFTPEGDTARAFTTYFEAEIEFE